MLELSHKIGDNHERNNILWEEKKRYTFLRWLGRNIFPENIQIKKKYIL